MKNNRMFDKFKTKLILEAVLNSVMSGLSVGCSASGLISLICWLAGFKDGIWVALGVGLGLAVIATVLFYFLSYRPTEKQTSRRVDAIGLQERAVTMLEYQNDDSVIASHQRSDAVLHIASASAKSMKAVFPLPIILSLVCTVAVSVPLNVVGGLYSFGLVESPLLPEDPLEQFIEVSYEVEGEGEIDGEADQLVIPGEDAMTVVAVPADGWHFVKWSDESTEIKRTDINITENTVIYAIFDIDPDNGDADAEPGNVPGDQGDEATDQPGDDAGQADSGEGDGNSDKGNGEGSGNGDQNKGDGKGDGQGDGAGGKWSEGNKIINGEIFYRDYLKQYHAEAMQELTSLDDIPAELREFIEAYYESV